MDSKENIQQQKQQNVVGSAENLIDLSPDLMCSENLIGELRNFKSDLLVLTKEMENIRMGNKRDLLEISSKFNRKMVMINSRINENKAFSLAQQSEIDKMIEEKMAKLESENIEMEGKIKEEIGELRTENVELKNENANMKEAIEEMRLEMAKMNAKLEEKQANDDENADDSSDNLPQLSPTTSSKAVGIEQQQLEESSDIKTSANLPNQLQIDDLKNNAAKSSELLTSNIDFIPMDVELCYYGKCVTAYGYVLANSSPICQWCSARSILPIPLFNSNANKQAKGFYFEVQILQKNSDISIGFCDRSFPLKGDWLGNWSNSIGICSKDEIRVDRGWNKLDDDFGRIGFGDSVGIGLVYSQQNSSLKCFASCNGQFLGSIDLPAKFIGMEIFPATSLWKGDSIHINFGQKNWRFNPCQFVHRK